MKFNKYIQGGALVIPFILAAGYSCAVTLDPPRTPKTIIQEQLRDASSKGKVLIAYDRWTNEVPGPGQVMPPQSLDTLSTELLLANQEGRTEQAASINAAINLANICQSADPPMSYGIASLTHSKLDGTRLMPGGNRYQNVLQVEVENGSSSLSKVSAIVYCLPRVEVPEALAMEKTYASGLRQPVASFKFWPSKASNLERIVQGK